MFICLLDLVYFKGFYFIFSYVLGEYFGMGVFGVWVAMVIDWVFRALCFVIRYYRGGWKKQSLV